MALKAYLTSEEHEALDESARGLYVEQDDGYRLDVESANGWNLGNISGLESTLRKQKQELAKLKTSLKSYEGMDPEAARAALERIESMGEGDAKVKDQIESVRRQMAEVFDKERSTLTSQAQALEEQLKAHLVQAAAAQALKGANAKLLMPHIERAVRVEKDESGKYRIKVLDAEGNEITSKKPDRIGMSIDLNEYAETHLRHEFPEAFPGTGQSGSGAGGSARSGGVNRFTISAAEAKSDPRAFQRVEAEAVKAGTHATIVE